MLMGCLVSTGTNVDKEDRSNFVHDKSVHASAQVVEAAADWEVGVELFEEGVGHAVHPLSAAPCDHKLQNGGVGVVSFEVEVEKKY